VGHLVGDLIELGYLQGPDEAWPLAVCVQAVLASYDTGDDATFGDRVQSWASLAVIDHVARLQLSGLLPTEHPAISQLARLARAVLYADDLGEFLTNLYGDDKYAKA
jgi:hypothetical protein